MADPTNIPAQILKITDERGVLEIIEALTLTIGMGAVNEEIVDAAANLSGAADRALELFGGDDDAQFRCDRALENRHGWYA